MKCVILAGGLGTRISEETSVRPKPMIEIGGRPILWHIMKIYAAHGIKEFTQEDLVPNEEVIVVVTKDGYIKSLPPDTFRTQIRGGKGVIGLTTKEQDVVEHFFATMTHSDILFFTSRGRVYQLKGYEGPKGTAVRRLK